MKKNVAIIGFGGQGGWHGEQILKSDVVALAGVYDIRECRQEYARNKGIHIYGSTEELLSDPQVDIVLVATPNDLHKQLVVQALNTGKHVICEKPVEMTVSALDEMTAAAEKNHRVFTVHQNRRWDVDYLAIQQLVLSGEIGKPLNIESRIHGSRGIPSDWRCQKAHGGGMILDWGVHLIDQMLQLYTEKVVRVYCTVTHITNQEVDDGFKLHLNFADGGEAYVEVGTYNFLALPRFYMQCEQGTASITDWKQKCHVAKLTAWNEKDVLPVQTAAGITKTMAPRDELTLQEYDLDRPLSDVHDFYRNYCAVLDGKAELLVKPEEVRRVLQVMEAAFASSEQQAVISTDI